MVMLEVTFYNSTFHIEFMYTSSLSLVPPKKNLEDTLLILIPEQGQSNMSLDFHLLSES